MNPITLYKFMQAYPMETHKNTDLQITEDLYLRYNHVVTETGGIQQNIKLLSKECDKTNEKAGISQQYIARFDCWNSYGGYKWYVRNIRNELVSIYAPQLANLSINSYDGGRNGGEWIADALYYQLNPLEIKYKNGKFKRGVGSCLTRRLNGFAYKSDTTQAILYALIDEAYDNIPENEVDKFQEAQHYINNVYGVPSTLYRECYLTGDVAPRAAFRQRNISGVKRQTLNNVSPDEFGYIRAEGRSYEEVWHLPDEIYVEGEVLKKTDANLTTCIACGNKVLHVHTSKGKCLECLPVDYKVQSYSYKVQEHLSKQHHCKIPKQTAQQYMGIELEYQVDNLKRGYVYVGDMLGRHARMKHDGSIRDQGFEIVSKPATYEVHMPKYKSFLDNLPEHIHPHASCGMHVHVSRDSLSHLGIGIITEFLNKKDNESFLVKIAGRNPNQFARTNPSYDIKLPYKAWKGHTGSYAERYNFINLGNTDTIEFRMFATPDNYNDFAVRMQFVKALCDYAMNRPVGFKEAINKSNFINWVVKQGNSFKELVKFMKGNQLCA